MNNNKLLRKSGTTEINFEQAILTQPNTVEVSLVEEKINREQQNESIIPHGEMLLIPVYFLTLTILLIALKSFKLHKPGINQKAIFNRSTQIPCRRCRFFKDTHYLKCAVHPNTALKAEAVNCDDYHPQNNIYN